MEESVRWLQGWHKWKDICQSHIYCGKQESTWVLMIPIRFQLTLFVDKAFQTSDLPQNEEICLAKVDFVLTSLEFNLVKDESRGLASLCFMEMKAGVLITGSGDLNIAFSCADVAVQDKASSNTLFPAVLKSMSYVRIGDEVDERLGNFNDDSVIFLRFRKQANGDQDIFYRSSMIAIFASPTLFDEARGFFTLPSQKPIDQSTASLITTKEGLSETVDFDKREGKRRLSVLGEIADSTAAAVSDSVSANLVNRWRRKEASRNKLTVDCEIDAPLVVVPSRSMQVTSPVLVLDLGHLRVQSPASLSITSGIRSKLDESYDWLVEVRDLTVSIKPAEEFARKQSAGKDTEISFEVRDKTLGLLDPFTLSIGLRFGVGKDASSTTVAADVPDLQMRVNPDRVRRLLTIAGAWSDLSSKPVESDGQGKSSQSLKLKKDIQRKSFGRIASKEVEKERLKFSVGLRKLSLSMSDQGGRTVSLNLVQTALSYAQTDGGMKSAQVLLKSFWISLSPSEDCQTSLLLAHTNLPEEVIHANEKDQTSVTELMRARHAFERTEEHGKAGARIKFTSVRKGTDITALETNIDAYYSNLHICWRYNIVELANAFNSSYSEVLEMTKSSPGTSDKGTELEVLAEESVSSDTSEKDSSDTSEKEVVASSEIIDSTLSVSGRLDAIVISLYDLSSRQCLYSLTMAATETTYSLEGSDTRARFVVGDLKLQTFSSSVHPDYSSLVGLAPGSEKGLLSVTYIQGSPAGQGNNEGVQINSEVSVELSETRVVYWQEDVFQLMSYVNKNILEPIPSEQTEIVKKAAKDASKKSSNSNQRVLCQASGLSVVIPEASQESHCLTFRVGGVKATQTTFSPGEFDLAVGVEEMVVNSSRTQPLTTNGINFDLNVVAEKEKIADPSQAPPPLSRYNVDASLSRVTIAFTQSHLLQLLYLSYGNLSFKPEQDDEIEEASTNDEKQDDEIEEASANDKKQDAPKSERTDSEDQSGLAVNSKFSFAGIDIAFCDIFALRGDDSSFHFDMAGRSQEYSAKVALAHLELVDVRHFSSHEFPHMISHNGVEDKEIFRLEFVGKSDRSKHIDVMLDGFQVVVLPDVISDAMHVVNDVMNLTKRDEGHQVSQPDRLQRKKSLQTSQRSSLSVAKNEALVERTDVAKRGSTKGDATSMFVSFNAPRCQMLLVDVSGQSNKTNSVFVFSGDFSLQTETSTSDQQDLSKARIQLQGDDFEVFTAQGGDLVKPVQILEPTSMNFDMSFDRSQEPSHLKTGIALPRPIAFSISTEDIKTGLSFVSSMQKATGQLSKTQETSQASGQSQREERNMSMIQNGAEREPSNTDKAPETFQIQFNFSMLAASLLFINDSYGLDQALFRTSIENLAVGCNALTRQDQQDEKMQICLDSRLNLSVVADFFDSMGNRWEPLLTSPWSVTLQAFRKGGASSPNGMVSELDVSSGDFKLYLTEKFVAGIGGARNAIGSMISDTNGLCPTNYPSMYCINNCTNVVLECEVAGSGTTECTDQISFFDFPHRDVKGKGTGRLRKYGHDEDAAKRLDIRVSDQDGSSVSYRSIRILEKESSDIYAKRLPSGEILFSEVLSLSKAKVIHVRLQAIIHNCTGRNYQVLMASNGQETNVGKFEDIRQSQGHAANKADDSWGQTTIDPFFDSVRFPTMGLPSFDTWHPGEAKVLVLRNLSDTGGAQLTGRVKLSDSHSLSRDEGKVYTVKKNDVPFSVEDQGEDEGANKESGTGGSLCIQLAHKVTRIGSHLLSDIYLLPRLVIRNDLPVPIQVKSPSNGFMPGLIDGATVGQVNLQDHEHTFRMQPQQELQFVGHEDIVEISLKLEGVMSNKAGCTGWMKAYARIPVVREEAFEGPINCVIPGSGDSTKTESYVRIEEIESSDSVHKSENGNEGDNRSSDPLSCLDEVRRFAITFANIAVDHTGGALHFQRRSHGGQSGLLRSATTTTTLHMLSTASGGATGFSFFPGSEKSLRFFDREADRNRISQDVVIGKVNVGIGGIQATELQWDDGSDSGYYAYKKPLLGANGDDRFEVHFIPRYLAINETDTVLHLRGAKGVLSLKPGEKKELIRLKGNVNVEVEIAESDNATAGPLQFEKVGTMVCPVIQNEEVIGTIKVQIAVGNERAHLVVRIGQIVTQSSRDTKVAIFAEKDDCLNISVRHKLLEVKLVDTGVVKSAPDVLGGLDRKLVDLTVQPEVDDAKGRKMSTAPLPRSEVAIVHCSMIALDFARGFTGADSSGKENAEQGSDRRSRLTEMTRASVTLRQMMIYDCFPASSSPIAFTSSSKKFLEVSTAFRGPLDADVVRVDQLNFNLASSDEDDKDDGTIIIDTSEDFLRRILDVVNRINVMTDTLTPQGTKSVVKDQAKEDGRASATNERLYNFVLTRISPFTLLITFVRRPKKSGYDEIESFESGVLLQYMLNELKFSLNNTQLYFKEYEQQNIRGPLSELTDYVMAYYQSRLKYKWFKIIRSVSIDDWAALAGRNDDEDAFVYGDLSRTTGMLTGMTLGFAFRATGKAIGDSIETVTEKVGLGAVGRTANVVFSGIGEGAESLSVGAGRGAGQVIGGLEGGLSWVGHGIVGGVKKASFGSIVGGVRDGAKDVATGTAKGTETTAKGMVSGLVETSQGFRDAARTAENSLERVLMMGNMQIERDANYLPPMSRWRNTAVFAMAVFSSVSMWPGFLATSDSANSFFSESKDGHDISSRTAALLYSSLYLPGTFLSRLITCADSVRRSVIVGITLATIGAAIRFLAALPLMPKHSIGGIFLAGQTLSGLGFPFIMNEIGRVSFEWFGVKERDGAATVLILVSAYGLAFGYFLPVLCDIAGASLALGIWVTLLVQLGMSFVALILVLYSFKSFPPSPVSRSAAGRTSMKKRLFRSRGMGSILGDENDVEAARVSLEGESLEEPTTTEYSNQSCMERCRTTFRQIALVMEVRDYRLLLLSFAISFGSICSVLSILLPRSLNKLDKESKEWMIGCVVTVGVGTLVNIMSLPLVAQWHPYSPWLKCGAFLLVLFLGIDSIFALGHIYVFYGVALILGFVCMPMLTMYVLSILECTYPIDEDVSIGLTFSIFLAVASVAGVLIGRWAPHFEKPDEIMRQVLLVANAVGLCITCCISGEKERLQYELGRKSPEEEPLLGEVV